MPPRGLLVGFLVCAACGIATRIDTIGPEFSGKVTVRQRGNVLPTPMGAVGAMELNLEREDWPEMEPEFALLVEVHTDELRIRPREPLRLIVDADTVTVPRDSTNASWPRLDPTVREQARYPSTDSLLIRLAGATDVRIAVQGAVWVDERKLSERNLVAIRTFVAEYVDAEAAAEAAALGPRVRGGDESSVIPAQPGVTGQVH